MLLEMSKVRRIDTPLLFPSWKDPQTPMDVTKPWEAARAAAGIENFRFHDLRHTAASHLAMSGGTLLELAHVLGHRTLAMVKRYSHLTESHTGEIVEKMNRRLFGGET
jgi:integrase